MIKLVLLLLLTIPTFSICPDHGIKGAFDGNTRWAGKQRFCEFEHPVKEGGVHRFWSECK